MSRRHPTLAAAAFFFALFQAVPSLAETVMLDPFFIDEGRPIPCDAQELLGQDLTERGCVIWDQSIGIPPDVVITGDYEEVGGIGWLTIRAFDAVVGRVVLGENIHIPSDPWLCRHTVKSIADKILSPPFYERERRNLYDAVSGVEFVLIPGGTFRTGAKKMLRNIPSFFISRYEITQSQWERMMGSNPSTFTGNSDRPVESVSWLDVQEYIEKLRRVGRQEYRLPTELEWEYAAQSRGRSQRWAGTDKAEESDAYVWSRENSGAKTHAVGQKKGNGLGLHDMGGNVWEWCQDWYEDDSGAKTASKVKGRVIRGGSWMVDRSLATTHSRDGAAPESRSSDNGFRLVLPLLSSDQPEKPKPAARAEEPEEAEPPREGGE